MKDRERMISIECVCVISKNDLFRLSGRKRMTDESMERRKEGGERDERDEFEELSRF